MNRINRVQNNLINIFFPLLIGAVIYFMFRSKSLLMFSWADKLFLTGFVEILSEFGRTYKDNIPNWVYMSLPDALWCYSFSSIMWWIWDRKLTTQSFVWVTFVPFLCVFAELGQYFGLIRGTFDIVDFYLILISLFLVFFRLNPIYRFFYDKN